MRRMLLLYDDVFSLHDDPVGVHMEAPQRISRVFGALREAKLYTLLDHRTPYRYPWVEKSLCDIHSCDYVAKIRELSRHGGGYVDADTYVNEYTYDAALRYAEAVIDAAIQLLEHRYDAVFVPGRPPGHHAGIFGAAMGAPTLGFCIFNVSALAATYMSRLVKGKILVVDIDLHHGNGTQEILYENPRVVHLDLHQDPSTIYPGTGWPWQIGGGEAKGTKINLPLPPGAGDDIYIELFRKSLSLVIETHGVPEYVIVDAGFDAYHDDGLGLLNLTTQSYYAVGRALYELGVGVLVALEGGYSAGLEKALPAFLAGLLGVYNPYEEEPTISSEKAWRQALQDFDEARRKIVEARALQPP